MQMQIGNYIVRVDPWTRQNAFWRLIALAILGAWCWWSFVIYQEGQEIQARIQAVQEEKNRQNEIQRRQAAYERVQTEQRLNRQGARNVMDTLPKNRRKL